LGYGKPELSYGETLFGCKFLTDAYKFPNGTKIQYKEKGNKERMKT